MATNVAPDGYYRSVIPSLSSNRHPDKLRQNGWTTINPPGKITPTLDSIPPVSHHDVVEPQSQQASKLRSKILASAELMKWPPGPRKRKKSPTQSPSRPRKKTRFQTTRSEISGRVVKFPGSGKTLLEPCSPPLPDSELNISSPEQVVSPWNSNTQNANISKKRSPTKTLPHKGSSSPSDTVGGRKTVPLVDHQPTTLTALEENSDNLFMDSSDGLEEFLKAEQLLAGTIAQITRTTPQLDRSSNPLRSDLDLQSEGREKSSPMTPFMRSNFHPQPPGTRTTDAPTVTGLSTLTRTLTCFRIAEAIRLLSFADPSQPLTFELFGVSRTPTHAAASEMANSTMEIADLFFPHRPPSLRLDIDPAQVPNLNTDPPTSTLHPSDGPNADASRGSPTNLVRTIIRAWPKSPGADTSSPRAVGTTVRDKFAVRVIRARATTWEEIRATRSLVEASSTVAPT